MHHQIEVRPRCVVVVQIHFAVIAFCESTSIARSFVCGHFALKLVFARWVHCHAEDVNRRAIDRKFAEFTFVAHNRFQIGQIGR